MAAEARGVDQGAVAGLEVGLIGVDRGAPGRGPVILVCFTAADRPGLIAGLMIVQDGIAVGVLEIVGDAGKVRGPVSGLAVVATADDPGADGLVAAVGDPNALAYRGPSVRLALDGELEAGGAVVEGRPDLAWHDMCPLCV